ncbi:hypothetical protein HanXRQr2_Chr02g0075371 [Helianthus annuus]|uniref:Uncharacterized protein n=1 Tax=Helianthus annuus TaxID=4232 RepID=A0A9K3JP76_HELAN|nr:hypothetical protein HanXRQr2_Chr02g0075371 [Helianthus annuus]
MTGYKKVGVLMNQFERKALKVIVDFLSNEDVLKTLNCYFVVYVCVFSQ